MTEYTKGYIGGVLSVIVVMLLFTIKPCKAQSRDHITDLISTGVGGYIVRDTNIVIGSFFTPDTSKYRVLVTKCRNCFAIPEIVYILPKINRIGPYSEMWYWKRTGFFGKRKFVKVPDHWQFWTQSVLILE